MTADYNDGHKYRPASSFDDAAKRRHYWAVAIGLQAVDGLEVSPYLKELANDYEHGKYSLAETGELIRSHYSNEAGEHESASHKEADLVSQRIAELLSGAPFVLDAEIIQHIHAYLFQDLDEAIYHPGQFKAERMIKQEEILNGDSVLYADPLAYDSSLRMYFNAEQKKDYGTALTGDALAEFVHGIAFLWQVHPFAEGNTRTVAVFSELYLNHLGFTVSNEPFEKHSRYYRDALVRAMYRNAAAEVNADDHWLVDFYDNVVNDSQHELNREELICTPLFENPTLLRNVSPEYALKRQRYSAAANPHYLAKQA